MWELDHKEGWALKSWCFQIVVLEKTLESPLNSKIEPVNPKGNQPWIFIQRTDAETSIFWPPDSKSQFTGSLWRWERLKAKRKGECRGLDWLENIITNSIDMNSNKTQEILEERGAWRAAVIKSQTRLKNWTKTARDNNQTHTEVIAIKPRQN